MRLLCNRTAWLVLIALLGPRADAAGQAPRYLVVPFDNVSPDAQMHWLGEASAVILTDDLIALQAPAITREDRVRAFDRLRVRGAATLSHATVIRVGQLVGAGVAVVGSVDATGQELIVRARSIRLDVGRMSPEIVERGPVTEMFDIYARIARQLAPQSTVSAEDMEQGHPPIAAFEQYVKGLIAYAPTSKIAFLSQALRIHPEFQRVRIELWNAHTDLAQHKQALEVVRAVPSTHRLGRQAQFLTAISMLHLADYPQAFTVLSGLNASRPDSAILNNLGVVQLRRPAGSATTTAASHFQAATEADPTDADLFFNLGYAFWLQKDAATAVRWLREAVRRDPADAASHYVLGVALQAAGSLTEAAREKELAKRLSSEYADWDAKQAGRNETPRGLERIKTDVDVPASLRVERMIVAAEQRDQRELAAFHLEAGRRAYLAEQDTQAIAELKRAVYLAPYESPAHLLLGRVYLRSGRLDEAIDEFKIAIWCEDTVAAHLALADAYAHARDSAAARAELEWILRAAPDNAEARRMLEALPAQ